MTDSGEEVKFDKGEIIENPDGSITIKTNKFTMPYESVTIIASFSTKNPETKDLIIIFIGIMTISLALCMNLFKISKKESN